MLLILWSGFEGSLPVLVYMLVYVVYVLVYVTFMLVYVIYMLVYMVYMLVYATLTRVLICHCANNNVLQEEELSAPV